jgi:hypothetical protein
MNKYNEIKNVFVNYMLFFQLDWSKLMWLQCTRLGLNMATFTEFSISLIKIFIYNENFDKILYINSVSICVSLSVKVLKPRSHMSVCRGPEQISSVHLSRSWTDPICPSVKVLEPRSQIEIPNRFQNRQGLKKCPPILEGPKTIQDLNHTLLLLYLPSPESRVPSPNA